MAQWAAALLFLYEVITFLVVRVFETVKYIFHQGFRDGRQRLPELRNSFLALPATKLAEMIREKQITSEELVKALIDRIQKVNPLLNAMTEDRFGPALEEARRADEELSRCEDIEELKRTKPFLGVPFTVKDCISVEGMLAEVGNESFRGNRATSDAVCVSRMKAAGGIPLAITNVPEMCLWVESSNHLHGRTNNPFDLHRTPGGSSGGEGALVSACASVWGIGSDIAGSIRLPSSWCGLFGHKPTPEKLTRKGLLPELGQDLKSRIGVIGPMARSADDLKAMVRVLADNPASLRLDDPVDLSSLRYFFCDHEGTTFISAVLPDVRRQVHRVVDFVKNDLKVEVSPLPNPEAMSRCSRYWYSYLEMNNYSSLKLSFDPDHKTWNPWSELFKHATGHSARTLTGIVISIADDMLRSDVEQCRKNFQEFEQYRERLYELLKDDGILILPSSVTVAPFHHGTMFHPGLYLGLAGLINVLKLPSTVVPMGLDSRGLPLSVQIIAGHGHDRLTLAMAKALEDKFGGFVPPCKIVE